MDKKSAGQLMGLSLVWSLYYIFSQVLVTETNGLIAGVVIRVLTFFILLIVAAMTGRMKELHLPKLRMLLWLMLIGTLGFLLDFTAFLGLQFSNAGSGTVLLKTDVLMAALIGAVAFHEHFRKRDVVAIAMMFIGVLFTMNVTAFNISGATDLFFILSALFVTLNAFVIRHVLHHPSNPETGLAIGFYNNFFALVWFAGAVLFSGSLPLLLEHTTDPMFIGASMAAGLGQSLVYLLYYAALEKHPVWLVKVALLMMPVFTTLIETVTELIREGQTSLTLGKVVGMVLVLFGAAVLLTKQKIPKISL